MNILRMMAQGASSIADSYVNPRAYDRSSSNGFSKDREMLRSDVIVVGKDMEKAITYGKSYAAKSRK